MLCLIIRDGWGVNQDGDNNAVTHADPPFYKKLLATCSRSLLEPGGEAVGLPEGQMGNSEVGHMNIGSGRVIYQDLVRISKDLREGRLHTLPVFKDWLSAARAGNSRIHLLGLLSDGGVHSHQEHLFGLLSILADQGFKEVYLHAFLDGRDTLPSSGLGFVKQTQQVMQKLGCGRFGSVGGRYYGMDRDQRWERIEKATDVLLKGKNFSQKDVSEIVADSYAKGVTDEFLEPTLLDNSSVISANDSVLFFNFRPDRARQLSSLLQKPELSLNFITMTPYGKEITVPCLYPKDNLNQVLSQVLAEKGMKQLKIAETEKYAHVTYFFNGGREEPFSGEERILVPSPKVETYDLKPEMSAFEVTEKLVAAISERRYDFIAVNYANPDMVGHTGNMEAAIQAVKVVDGCVQRVVEALHEVGGTALITADHGNLDEMYDIKTKEMLTNHSLNPVDLILSAPPGLHQTWRLKPKGKLADIAPTILTYLGLQIPEVMDGEVLVYKE